MFIAILILIIIASLLLTFVVLIQNSKGGGLAANFAAGNQTFGVRQTADFLEKATWTLAIIILALCILATAFVPSRKQGDNAVLERLEQMGTNTGTPEFPTTLPGGDAAPAEPADPAAAPAE
ncbi:MAG TPA: preprotein translocase subunit SecG [Candidatus Coprenecus merdigallinarum]|nr:preprotein translocase subunit SecG [Candidatus Coprenecus merdigallinarum]